MVLPTAAVAATPAADSGSTAAPAQPVPYAETLKALIKAWPKDLAIAWTLSSGGVPPHVLHWQVDSKGLGKFEQVTPGSGPSDTRSWSVTLPVAELRELLMALTLVDFEHARKPVPDSPVQFVAISSGGQTAYIDAYALLPPVTTQANQAIVFKALSHLQSIGMASRPDAVAPPTAAKP